MHATKGMQFVVVWLLSLLLPTFVFGSHAFRFRDVEVGGLPGGDHLGEIEITEGSAYLTYWPSYNPSLISPPQDLGPIVAETLVKTHSEPPETLWMNHHYGHFSFIHLNGKLQVLMDFLTSQPKAVMAGFNSSQINLDKESFEDSHGGFRTLESLSPAKEFFAQNRKPFIATLRTREFGSPSQGVKVIALTANEKNTLVTMADLLLGFKKKGSANSGPMGSSLKLFAVETSLLVPEFQTDMNVYLRSRERIRISKRRGYGPTDLDRKVSHSADVMNEIASFGEPQVREYPVTLPNSKEVDSLMDLIVHIFGSPQFKAFGCSEGLHELTE